MKFDEEKVLEILALAIGAHACDCKVDVPACNYLIYILKKLYGLDGLNLDKENNEIFKRMVKLKEELLK
jgi:hypothetical protein